MAVGVLPPSEDWETHAEPLRYCTFGRLTNDVLIDSWLVAIESNKSIPRPRTPTAVPTAAPGACLDLWLVPAHTVDDSVTAPKDALSALAADLTFSKVAGARIKVVQRDLVPGWIIPRLAFDAAVI